MLTEVIDLIVINKTNTDNIYSQIKQRMSSIIEQEQLNVWTDPLNPEGDRADRVVVGKMVVAAFWGVVTKSMPTLNKDGELTAVKLRFGTTAQMAIGIFDASVPEIVISTKLVARTAKLILDRLRSLRIDFPDISSRQLTTKLFNAEIESSVKGIYDVFAHEVVHAYQSNRAAFDPYRSYIQRDVDRFFEELDSAVGSMPNSYYGSPEEIGAFAHQRALRIISSMKSDKPEKALETINKLLPKIVAVDKSIGYDRFNNSRDKIERQVLNRFYKKVYTDLDRYRDHLKATVESNKHAT